MQDKQTTIEQTDLVILLTEVVQMAGRIHRLERTVLELRVDDQNQQTAFNAWTLHHDECGKYWEADIEERLSYLEARIGRGSQATTDIREER